MTTTTSILGTIESTFTYCADKFATLKNEAKAHPQETAEIVTSILAIGALLAIVSSASSLLEPTHLENVVVKPLSRNEAIVSPSSMDLGTSKESRYSSRIASILKKLIPFLAGPASYKLFR